MICKAFSILIFGLTLVFSPADLLATIRYVNSESSVNVGCCIYSDQPCRSITYAIGCSSSDDTIRVAQGTYLENLSVSSAIDNFSIQGGWNSDFTVRSETPSLTMVNGRDFGSVLNVTSSSGRIDFTVEGLTFFNGKSDYGGGLYLWARNSGEISLKLLHCRIEENEANGGGGVYARPDDRPIALIIQECTMEYNTAEFDGGAILVAADEGSLTLNMNKSFFMSNQAGRDGGGLWLQSRFGGSIQADLTDNDFYCHADEKGGGIYAFADRSPLILSSRGNYFENSASDAGGDVYLKASFEELTGTFKQDIFHGIAGMLGGALCAGVYGAGGYIDLDLVESSFSQNQAYNGGGIYLLSSGSDSRLYAVMKGNVIWSPYAEDNGGGLFLYAMGSGKVETYLTNNYFLYGEAVNNGGQIYAVAGGGSGGGESIAILTNNTFYMNEAIKGGGLYAGAASGGTTDIHILNTILWGNTADNGGDIYLDEDDDPNDSSVEVNASYSDIGEVNNNGGTYIDGDGNRNEDPQISDPSHLDYRLAPTSAMIDRGRCGNWIYLYPPGKMIYMRAAPYCDFEEEFRPGYGEETGCDIGADEFYPHRYVNPGGDDTGNDCSLAKSPCRTIQHALGESADGDALVLSRGVYNEDVHLNATKTLTLRGGYKPGFFFRGTPGLFVGGDDLHVSTINGNLTTSQGAFCVE